jgi:CheY-like chemotaxis protein
MTSPHDTTSESRTPKAHILVVEDDPDVMEALCDYLALQGYEVRGAPDGAAALRLLGRDAPPNLILLDLGMPIMDGFEFLERRAQLPTLAAIPVVVMSATMDGFAQPGVDFVRKPLEIDLLLGTIERRLALP